MNTDMSRRQFVGLAGSLATVLGLGLVGCGGGAGKGSAAGSAAAKDVKGAAESKKLVVGFDKSYPPYGFVGDDGEYTGFDLDLAKAVADKQDWEVKYEAIDWDAKDTLLNSGAINCIWNGFTMEGREDDQKDLAATFATLDTIGEYNTAFMQLESGAVDAVACDLSIAQYQLAAKPDAYTQLDEPLSSEHYAVGFKKGDTKSADAVAESLKALYEDGTVKDLCDKYSSYGLSFDNWVLK